MQQEVGAVTQVLHGCAIVPNRAAEGQLERIHLDPRGLDAHGAVMLCRAREWAVERRGVAHASATGLQATGQGVSHSLDQGRLARFPAPKHNDPELGIGHDRAGGAGAGLDVSEPTPRTS